MSSHDYQNAKTILKREKFKNWIQTPSTIEEFTVSGNRPNDLKEVENQNQNQNQNENEKKDIE